MTDEPIYPFTLVDQDGCEIIHCGPRRFRIIFNGKYQGWRTNFADAAYYCYAEGLLP